MKSLQNVCNTAIDNICLPTTCMLTCKEHIKILTLSPGQTDLQVDASQRKFATCVRLAFRLATHLRGLATTCVDFGRAQIWTQVDASFLPFGHPVAVNTS